MLERRLWSNFALLFFGLIICLSLWQMSITNSDSSIPYVPQYTNVPAYVLNTINSTYTYPLEELPTFDYEKLMNLTNFQFNIINECTDSPLLLVLIHTSPENFDRRKSIRETWAGRKKHVKVVFVVGKIEDWKLQRKLEEENEKHKDFIQGNFLDAYRNMTYKHVMTLKYAIYHCPHAKYILKTDDDVFVNMFTMMDFLNVDLSPYGVRNLLLCTPLINSPVKRTFRSKWRVAFHEFKDKYYPPYCPGWALMYSPDVLFKLYKDVQNSKYFWIDDVLITGILAKNRNIQHTSAQSLILPYNTMMKITDSNSHYNDSKTFLYGPPNLTVEQMYSLWEYVKLHSTANIRTDFKNHS